MKREREGGREGRREGEREHVKRGLCCEQGVTPSIFFRKRRMFELLDTIVQAQGGWNARKAPVNHISI